MKILTIAPHTPQAPPAPSGAASWLLSSAALRSEHSVGVLAAAGCDTAALEWGGGAAAVFTCALWRPLAAAARRLRRRSPPR